MPLSRISSPAIASETIIPEDILDFSITSNQLSNTGVTSTVYGGGTSGTVIVPVINTDRAGRITSAANQTLSLTSFGDISVTKLTSSGQANLPILAVNTSFFTSNITITGTTSLAQAREKVTIIPSGAGGTIAFDTLSQGIVYYTSVSTSNFTLNVKGDSGVSLNSILSVGQSVTVVVITTQGASSWYMTGVQVDGTATGVTTKWATQAPAAGGTNGIDAYTVTVIKTGNATYTALGSFTKFV